MTGAPITVPITRAYSAHLPIHHNWEQVLRVLKKNRLFVCLLTALVSLGVVAYTLRLKDVYAPAARLEIDPPSSAALSPRDQETADEYNQEYLETQSQILQSDELATRVIRSLHLDRNAEIVGAKSLIRYAKIAATPVAVGVEEAGTASVQDQFNAAERTPLEMIALHTFHSRLSVGSVRGSRLVEVSFASNDPRLAQQVTNSLVAQFIDQNFKTRYATTIQASDWLFSQLSDLRQKVEESNQAVVDYQRRYGLVEEDDKDGPTSQLVSGVSHQLAEAQADRIQAEAYVLMIATGQAESLPQIRESQVYQTLTAQRAESSARLAQARAIYGEENNNYKKAQNELNELTAQLDAEKERIVNQVHTAYAAASEREQLMKASMARLKVQMSDVNERMVRYRMLRDESRANADLYNALLGRLKEAGLYAGLKSSNIRVVDPASVLDRPTAPHRSLIIATGTLLGGVFALVLAFARESLNNTIRTPDDVFDWTGLPSLAIIPLLSSRGQGSKAVFLTLDMKRKKVGPLPRLLTTHHYTAEGEAFRELRASILFSNPENPPRVLLVASPAAGEGKSLVAINLAVALSQRGKTCLMDCDLRRPVINSVFGYPPSSGWTDLLSSLVEADEAMIRVKWTDLLSASVDADEAQIRVKELENLYVLPVGSQPPNPGKWIGSEQMKQLIADLRSRFTFVVIDSPPTIPFSDARVLSSLADAVVLVGRCGLTTRRALTRCVESMQEFGAPTVGVVLNGMNFSSADYQYYNFGHGSVKLQDYYPAHPIQASSMPPSPPDDEIKRKGAGA